LEQEHLLRNPAEKRLIAAQAEVDALATGVVDAKEDIKNFERRIELEETFASESISRHKCKLCYNHPIEYVLLPCHHFGKVLKIENYLLSVFLCSYYMS
jgi:hypothetical protein